MSDNLPLDRACLLACGVITGLGAVVNTVQVPVGSSVVVIGTGGVGLNSVQGARLAGAAKIIAIDVLDHKLEAAKVFGATHVINAKNKDAVSAVLSLTAGRGADYALVTVGRSDAVSQANQMIRRGGIEVIVGMPTMADVKFSLDSYDMKRGRQRMRACENWNWTKLQLS